MRYRLRTFLIPLVIGPPIVATVWIAIPLAIVPALSLAILIVPRLGF